MAGKALNDFKGLISSINELAVKLRDGFFDRDYLDITADIDELEDKLYEIIRILRYVARLYEEGNINEDINDDLAADDI